MQFPSLGWEEPLEKEMAYFLHIGLNHCAKHLKITLLEKWAWPLSRCLCHQSFFFCKKEKKERNYLSSTSSPWCYMEHFKSLIN